MNKLKDPVLPLYRLYRYFVVLKENSIFITRKPRHQISCQLSLLHFSFDSPQIYITLYSLGLKHRCLSLSTVGCRVTLPVLCFRLIPDFQCCFRKGFLWQKLPTAAWLLIIKVKPSISIICLAHVMSKVSFLQSHSDMNKIWGTQTAKIRHK